MRHKLACWLVGLGVIISSRQSTVRHKLSYIVNVRRMIGLGTFTLNAAIWADIVQETYDTDSEETHE
jgi:hypothetical protein